MGLADQSKKGNGCGFRGAEGSSSSCSRTTWKTLEAGGEQKVAAKPFGREFLQEVFNLINNTVAALGGTGGNLRISERADKDWVHVHVIDTGVGIPEKIQPQIFDPSFTTKKVGEGTGLGLSLCYGIVKKHRGKISFASSAAADHPDRPTGTTFVVSMPVHREDGL